MRKVGIAVFIVLLSVAVVVGLVGCPQPQDQTVAVDVPPEGDQGEPAPQGEPYRIGALFAITGAGASLGQPERDAAKMLETQINAAGGVNGHPVEIIIRDTRGEETQALNAAKELIEKENVLAIIGPSRSGTTLGIISYLEQAETPLVSCAAARKITDPVRKWVFQVVPSDRHAVQRLYAYLTANNVAKIAVMTASSGYGAEGLHQLESQAEAAGIEIVTAEEFDDTDSDMTPQLARIKDTDAQAVICWGIGKAPALIAKNMAQLDLGIPLLQSSGVANERFIEVAGPASNGVIMPAAKLIVADQIADTDRQKETLLQFAADFEATYDRRPDHYGGHAWDAIQIIRMALEKAGDDKAALRDEIEKTTDFVGMGGIFNYSPDDHYGLTADAFALVRIEDGKWQLIE
jgi:branched-chain amino acid transport system substrate-binding protein